ncbi:MAG: tetratricopeptide repeat protein [Bacteroidota bacterium]
MGLHIATEYGFHYGGIASIPRNDESDGGIASIPRNDERDCHCQNDGRRTRQSQGRVSITNFFILVIISILITFTSTAQIPTNYHFQQAIKTYQTGNYELAAKQFKQSMAHDSSQQQTYVMIASSYMQLKEWDKASKYATLGEKKFPKEPIFNWQLGEINLQLGEYKKALNAYKELESRTKLPPQVSQQIIRQRIGECHSQVGREYANSKQWTSALYHFKQAKNHLAEKLYVYTNLAYAYAQQKNWSETVKVSDEGLEYFSNNEGLLKTKASAFYQLKKYDAAASVYAILYKISPDDITTGIAYGELLMASQNYATASAHYNKLIQQNPRQKEIYESLISIYENRLNYKGKIELLQQMLDHFDNVEIYKRIAQTYEKIQNWSMAKGYYDTLLSVDPNNELFISQKIAQLNVREGNETTALNLYKGLQERYPQNEDVLNALGECQESLEMWQEALSTYQKLLRLGFPSDITLKLARVLEQLDQPIEAMENYQASVKNRQSGEAYLGLSRLMRPDNQDSSLVLAKKAFDLTFNQLTTYERQLNQRLEGKNTINGLIDNESLILQIRKEEQLASQAFYHLASYPFNEVSEPIIGLTEQFSQSAKIHTYVGEYLYRHNLSDRSHEFLLKSVRLDPNQKEAHNLLGAIHSEKEQYRQSILAFERSLSIDNTDPEIYGRLINLYSKTDQLDQLCNKWIVRYRSGKDHEILKQPLIEALHKAERYDEAKKIIGEKI